MFLLWPFNQLSLKKVSIIVAPLRNKQASCKVLENVSRLLSLPFILGGPASLLDGIYNVFIEVKLVPNLVYASKLLCTVSSTEKSADTPSPTNSSVLNVSYKQIKDLSPEQVQTLCALYQLVNYLAHVNDIFLLQFCDAIVILGANSLMINFITNGEYFGWRLGCFNTNCLRFSVDECVQRQTYSTHFGLALLCSSTIAGECRDCGKHRFQCQRGFDYFVKA